MYIASLTDKPVAKKNSRHHRHCDIRFQICPYVLSFYQYIVRRNLDSSSAPLVQKVDRAIISYLLNTLYQVDNAIGWINTWFTGASTCSEMVKNFHRYNTNHPVDNLCEYVLGQEPAFWITKFPSFADVLPTFYERLSLLRWIGGVHQRTVCYVWVPGLVRTLHLNNETPLNRWIAAVHQRTAFKGLKYLVLIRVSRSRDQEL